ncbi:hypothetical protein LP414_27690 [Polaromonas sp. P1(28)-13]|nr:hypothetical protein LP414_27690 [Polaromonas sp. P1(28)-13]
MAKCDGRGYPGCDSCINREHDPFQCEECDDESNWEGDEFGEADDVVEDISMSDLIVLMHGDF